MRERRVVYMLATALLISCLCGSASGENAKSESKSEMVFNKIGSIIRPYANALGRHAQNKGQEKRIYVGEYFENGKSSNVRITIQLPRLARLEGFRGQNSVLAYDGQNKKNAVDRMDKALLEFKRVLKKARP